VKARGIKGVPYGRPCPFPEGGLEDEGKRRGGAPRGAPARVMGPAVPSRWRDRSDRKTGQRVRRSAPATFGAPLPSFWECEGFETDNLARQSAGMRRAATMAHGSANGWRKDGGELQNQPSARIREARLLRFAPNDVDVLVDAVIARSAQRDEAISATRVDRGGLGETNLTPRSGGTNPRSSQCHFGETNPRPAAAKRLRKCAER